MVRRSSLFILLMVFSFVFVSCGGGSSGSSGVDTTKRTVTGNLAGAGSKALISKAVGGSVCTQISPNICRVIATDTNGTTVIDESLSDCIFSLPLNIGSNYVISFVGPDQSGSCNQFLATLISSTGGNVFNISSGNVEINLGDILLDSLTGKASSSVSLDGFFGDIFTCEELNQLDSDGDDVCDGFEDVPTLSDFESLVECTTDADCSNGQICVVGLCTVQSTSGSQCTKNEDCSDGQFCKLGSCVSATNADLVGIYANPTTSGGANCQDDINSLPSKETVTVEGDVLKIEGTVNPNNSTFGCRHNATVLTLVNLQGNLNLDCYPGCVLDDTTNTFVFDTNVTNFTLKRTINTANGPTFTPGCEFIYTK